MKIIYKLKDVVVNNFITINQLKRQYEYIFL